MIMGIDLEIRQRSSTVSKEATQAMSIKLEAKVFEVTVQKFIMGIVHKLGKAHRVLTGLIVQDNSVF